MEPVAPSEAAPFAPPPPAAQAPTATLKEPADTVSIDAGNAARAEGVSIGRPRLDDVTDSVDLRLVALSLVPPPDTVEQRDVKPVAPREAAPFAPPPLAAHAPTGKAAPAESMSIGPPAREPALPPSALLLSGHIALGFPPRALEFSLEQRGFRINAKQPVHVPWSEVVDIRERRGRVAITTATRRFVFDVPIEGVAEPELAGPLARVIQEASGGSLGLSGSAYLELQRAADFVRDRFHEEDDPLIPSLVGLVFGFATAIFAGLLPVAVLLLTRPEVPSGAFLIAPRLSSFDPRVVLIALGAAALLASLVVRIAIGRQGAAWARGTLRGWHQSRGRFLDASARRALAAFVQYPLVSAALLLGGLVSALPSTRSHVIVDAAGVHVFGVLPFFDESRSWGTVTGIETIPAPADRHYGGIAVVFHFADRSPVNTLDEDVWGGTDGHLFEQANGWRAGAR